MELLCPLEFFNQFVIFCFTEKVSFGEKLIIRFAWNVYLRDVAQTILQFSALFEKQKTTTAATKKHR